MVFRPAQRRNRRLLNSAPSGSGLRSARKRAGWDLAPGRICWRRVVEPGARPGQQPALPGQARLGCREIAPVVGLDFQVARSSVGVPTLGIARSEEHTSELQSLMRISYAVFCLKKKKYIKNTS